MKPTTAGQLTRVDVEDVAFLVSFSWGDLKCLQRAFQELDPTDIAAFDQLMQEHVLPAVVKVEGLVDDAGAPVDTVTLETFDDYPPDLMMGLLMGLMDVGKRLGVKPHPPV